jgi:ATP-dependent protease ClpP protease subunit
MKTQNEAFITFACGITQKSVNTLVGVVNDMAGKGITKVTVHLSSTGGDLSPAFSAYHILRSLSIPLVMHNTGNVESSAVLLYLAADDRTAASHSRFLIHPFHWTFGGSVFLPHIKQAVASLEFDSRRYADIFNERTQGVDKPIDVLKCLNGEPLVIGADEAKIFGIVTLDHAETAIPAGAIHALIVES